MKTTLSRLLLDATSSAVNADSFDSGDMLIDIPHQGFDELASRMAGIAIIVLFVRTRCLAVIVVRMVANCFSYV